VSGGRYWLCVTVAFASCIGGLMLGAYAIHEIVQIGTCASGGPYVSRRPCPPGTEYKILAIFGALGLLFLGRIVWAFRGRGDDGFGSFRFGSALWVVGWLTLDGTMLVAAFGPAAPSGASGWQLAAIINAAVGIPIGLAPLVMLFTRRSKADAAESLVRDGSRAPGEVTAVEDTGITINENPRVTITVRVDAPGQAPFDIRKTFTASRVDIPRRGDRCTVFYDPNDHSRTAITFDQVPAGATTPAAPGAVPTSLGGAPPATWNPTAAEPRSSQAAPMSGAGTATTEAVAERLRKLDKLRDDGVITPAEHDAERARILDQL
jgi:Short C-terminal domain